MTTHFGITANFMRYAHDFVVTDAHGKLFRTDGATPEDWHGYGAPVLASGDGIVRVSRESKGRGGKTVTLVRGVALDAEALAALGKQLRTACGAGGTLRDGVLEIQGDHRERVIALLAAQGFVVKQAGG